MKYVVKCVSGFLDGNVFPRRIDRGEVLEVEELTYKKMKRSDPDGFTLVEKKLPISNIPDIQGMAYDEAIEVVERANGDELLDLSKQESNGKQRKTVLGAIVERGEEIDG